MFIYYDLSLIHIKHNVLVTLVHNRQYYHGTSLSASSNTFYLSTIHQIQNGDAASITASNKESKQTSMGYVGRLRYDYDNRYMAEFSGRYDGCLLYTSHTFHKGNSQMSCQHRIFTESLFHT